MSAVALGGFGLHCGFGDAAATAAALARGASAVTARCADGFPELRVALAAPFDLDAFVPDRKQLKYMSLATQLAVLAAGRALADASLLGDKERLARTALFVATGPIASDLSSLTRAAAACRTAEGAFDVARMGQDGLRLCHPLLPFKMLLNMPLALISITFGVRGENAALYPGADQAGVALEAAARGIRGGRFERALVGGSAQGLSPVPLAALLRRGLVATAGHADGWAVADMAAFLVLESKEAVDERGARVLGWIDDVRLSSRRGDTAEVAAGTPAGAAPDGLGHVLTGGAPATILTTGAATQEDRDALRLAATTRWPAAVPSMHSWDGQLGYAGCASALAAVGLAATGWAGVERKEAPCRQALVLSCAPNESLFGCRVTPAAADRATRDVPASTGALA